MDQSTFAYIARRQADGATATVGAVPPPPGVTANFTDPAYSTRSLDVFVAIGLSFAGLFILMRVYTKAYLLRNFGAEDIAIVLSFACAAVCCACILEGVKYGTGRHIWDIPATVLIPNWSIWVTSATVIYIPSMMFAKVAILLCFLRISSKRNFRIAVFVAIGIVVSYSIALMLSLIFGCNPIRKTWDLRITTGTCVNRPAVYLASAVINVVTDFMIILLPIPMIRDLHMATRQKILVAAMFSVGSLACIVSIIRIRTLVPTLHQADQTWALAVPAIWLVVEICLAVCCGCLSVIRPFLRHHFPLILGDSRTGHSNKRYSRHGYYKSNDIKSANGTTTTASGGTRRNIDIIALAERDDSTEMIKPPYSEANGGMESRSDEEIANPRKSFERNFGIYPPAVPEKGPKVGVMTPRHQSGASRGLIVPRKDGEQGIMRTVEVDVDRGLAM